VCWYYDPDHPLGRCRRRDLAGTEHSEVERIRVLSRPNSGAPRVDGDAPGCEHHAWRWRSLEFDCKTSRYTASTYDHAAWLRTPCQECATIKAGLPAVQPIPPYLDAAPADTVKADTSHQAEFRAAFGALADITGQEDLPAVAVRDVFRSSHHVDEADPKKANKKKLDAWAAALRRLPPGFHLDKEAGRIRRQPAQPLARAA
jgi:hypothetical protein